MNNDLVKQTLCIKCQKCCQVIVFPTIYTNVEAVREFYEARGMKVRWSASWQCLLVMMEFRCPHLGDFGCNIYSKRPKVCMNYDGRKDPFIGSECAWHKLDNPEKSIFDICTGHKSK